jgi:hypothetical protein
MQRGVAAQSKRIGELLRTKRLLTVVNPQIDISFGRKYLQIGKEQFPYEEVLGLILLGEREDLKPKKVPTFVIKKPLEVFNVKEKPYSEKSLWRIASWQCKYVDNELQKRLSKYLTNKGIFTLILKRFGRKKRWVKQNPDFFPESYGCPNDLRGLLNSISFHLRDRFVRELYLYAYLAMAFGTILATNLDLAIPPVDYLPFVFASPIYALTGTLWLRQENLELNPYSAIPPRGAVYVFYNEILNNEIFGEYLFRSLALLEE